MTAPQKKVYDQAELDQAVKEAGFATEEHRFLLEGAKKALEQSDRIFGRTKASARWLAEYARFNG